MSDPEAYSADLDELCRIMAHFFVEHSGLTGSEA